MLELLKLNEDGYALYFELSSEDNLVRVVLILAHGASKHEYELNFE